MMRVMLYEAAQSMLYSKKWSWLKAWAMQIARRRGIKKAIVALARRLAVILHRICISALCASQGGECRDSGECRDKCRVQIALPENVAPQCGDGRRL